MPRPGGGGSGDRWPSAGNRPNWPSRPGQGGSGERWPDVNRPGNRPNIGDRTNFGDRTNIGNNINSGNRGDINLTNNNITNTSNNFTSNRNWNGGGNWNNNWRGQYANWHRGSWNNWYRAPAAWYGTAVASGWLASPGDTYVYNNPFYVAPQSVVVGAAPVDLGYNSIDYSQPIPVPPQQEVATYSDSGSAAGYDSYPPSDRSNAPPPTTVLPPGDAQPPTGDAAPPDADIGPPPEAIKLFDAAREAFKSNDYPRALREVDKAIKLLPSDTTLHEFRALVLFAQGKYRDAAAGAYAVLSVGPGWTWETVREL
ncbi:MAG TPA: hypothetical protein VGZ26_00780, partial [Pirellulales bacterium]|nr:hypothetical protein [Pirellulales bacterium]